MELLEPRTMLAGDSTFVATSANPGEAEAISLYLVNQMRHAPQTWATLANIDLSKDWQGGVVPDLYGTLADLSPKDSLIYNDTLGTTAANYSSLLVSHGFLNHNLPDAGGNDRPWTRAAYQGYTGGNVTENLAYNMIVSTGSISNEQQAYTLVEQLFIDNAVTGAGHRMNILMADHSEVGFGFARGAAGFAGYDNYYTTQLFGTETSASSKPYLTGFVLNNADGNRQFNQGEGLAGVTVTIVDTTTSTTYTTTTRDSGYWAFPAVSGRTYTVSASGGSFAGTATATGVTIASGGTNGYNTRTVDFFSASGGSTARIDYGVPTNNAATGAVTISGELVIGATLTVDTSGLVDADGKGTLRYKWFVDGVELTDAFANGSVSSTSGTLTLTEPLSPNVLLATTGTAVGPYLDGMLLGHAFTVVVTYTDQAGALEAVASAETAAVGDMTVSEALARLNDTSIERISITDTGATLIAFANTLNGAANKNVYGKIKEFHLSDTITTNVADAVTLFRAIEQVKIFNDCFSYGWWKSPGASLGVEDTAENIAAAAWSANARSTLSNDLVASTVKITGGTISASDLVYAIDTYRATRKAGATVSVTGDLNALSSADRAKVISFLGDTTPPTFVSASQTAGTTSLVLTFSETLDAASPSAAAFDVVVNGSHQQPVSTAISGSTVVLTLSAAVSVGDTVTVSYAVPGSGRIKDLSGNAAAGFSAAPVTVVALPPVFQSATTNAAGTKIILTYDKQLSATTAQPEAFTVELYDSGTWANLIPRSVAAVVVSGNTVELTLDRPVNNGRNDVWVAYTDPTSDNDGNAMQEITGVDAASLSFKRVTNAVTIATTWLGTTGADTWSGGTGNDEAYANLGSDTLVGDGGNDILDLGYWASSAGGSLNDTSANSATGGDGNDEIYGTNGVDTMSGDAGDDFLYGSGGNDIVNGGEGDDQLHGRSGNDLLTGGAGDDFIDGGSGSGDVAVFSLARAAYTVTQSGSSYIVTAKSGTDGIDTVINVETFRFSDGDVAVANILAGNVAGATLTRTGSVLAAVSTTFGTASAETSTTISGRNLTGSVTATAPSGFQVSSDGSTWGSTATFTVAAGAFDGTLRARLAANADAGTYSGNVTVTGGGAAALSLSLPSSVVARKALTITAADVTKAGNQSLTGGSGSTAFAAAGLVLEDTVGTVTISYGAAGAAGYAGGAIGTYSGHVTPSAVTGGTFKSSNYDIGYVAGAIIVNAAPTIAVSSSGLGDLSTTYGTSSIVATFTVSGSTLLQTGPLTVTAPTGYQVSLDGTTFASTRSLSVDGTGVVGTTTVYVRIPATTAAGTYGGGANEVTVSGGGATTTTVPTTLSTVAKKELTISGLVFGSKTYDRTTTAPARTAATFAGLVNGESFTPTGAVSWAFSDRNAGVDKPLVRTGNYAAPSGNYTVTQPTRTATINAKPLTITAAAKTKAYGSADPTLTFAAVGLVAGDTLTGNLSRSAGNAVGTYAINQGSLSAGPNYAMTFNTASLTIAKRSVTIQADAVGKVEGQADPALTWKVSASTPLATGDTVHTAFTGALSRAAGEGVGSHAISRGTLDGGNYTIHFSGASFTIEAASTPLKINGVYVKGSTWSAGYQGLSVFTTIGSTNVGWSLADGSGQLTDAATIGWNNVDRISIRFSQPISQPAAGALSLVYGGTTAVAGSTTALDAPTLLEGGTIAQWTVPNLVSGKYRLVATAGMFASASNAANTLDGEWAAYAATFAAGSGNGTSGGDFAYDFDVLVGNVSTGDVNSTTKAEVMSVNMSDYKAVAGQGGKAITSLTFRCDVDGSGTVTAGDVTIVRARITAGLASSLSSIHYLEPPGRLRQT